MNTARESSEGTIDLNHKLWAHRQIGIENNRQQFKNNLVRLGQLLNAIKAQDIAFLNAS